ncbi:hypothetical protein FE782_17815 [Paenibacillus antri]|uniref:Uncharacterized protein n=1 Tax=Paenibacillus antri TaxID=2582848 RepID=A0A5R9GCM4_9BACL|nr:hypothetical protein [Paenibacillus antri]TLS50904.1 hypothetical protein FE782_17815 [Paenibacillus antri]
MMMNRKRRKSLLLVLMLSLLLALAPLPSAFSAALWDAGSLTEVYNPAGQTYAYAPAVLREGDAEHLFSCHNAEDGVFKDHIFYTKIVGGAVVESRSVLQAGPSGAWDSFHVCDPAVVAGKFKYGEDGHVYNYAMFYLGNDVDASAHNQIGVAFADTLDGTWVKYPEPIVTHPNDGFWGAGQPSVTSIDGQGWLMLFFTRGDASATAGYRVELRLGDMANPVVGTPLRLTNAGLVRTDGAPDFLNNFDVAYDPSRDRFYAVREMHPYPSGDPSYIAGAQQIVSISGGAVWGGGGEWKVEGTLNAAVTGFARNHNAALLRTPFGTLPQPDRLDVYFTDSSASPDLSGRAEFTYDVWRISAALNNDDPVVETPLPDFESKYFALTKLVENLNTNALELHGAATPKLADRDVWVGYRIYDHEGYLVVAGTAYRDRVAADGSFSIPVEKPALAGDKAARLEVYLLSRKGIPIDSAIRKVEF